MQIGQNLQKLCNQAQSNIILVAPFIKAKILKQLLININPQIKLQCVTRWLPEDIITGVCDLEIWEVIQTFSTASLWLKSDLHAKYYRFDNQCFVGSANLTAKALGWSNSSNLELLVQLSANDPYLQKFETELFKDAFKVSENWFNSFEKLITNISQENFTIPLKKPELIIDSAVFSADSSAWLPTLRNPEELYLAYSGDWDSLTTIACQTAAKDLSHFQVIPNLSKTAFKNYIGALLLQKPLIQKLDVFVKTPQRFGAVCNWLSCFPFADFPDFNPKTTWQTLMRWLLYFLPSRYAVSIPRHSEVFYRIQ